MHAGPWMSLSAAILACCIALSASEMAGAQTGSASEIAYEFRAQPQGARAWLASQGFEFRLDAGNTSRARISLGDNGLTIETLAAAEPLIARTNIDVAQPATLTVAWGVNRYPVGANWDAGVNNEAIMVVVFFGTETFPGGLLRPPSPYFIGFFLCDRGRRGVPITGRSYPRQGRYICLDAPAPRQEITSVIPLDPYFRTAFGATRVPPVTGFAIEADTTQVDQDARSSAWIRSIKIAPAR